MSDTLLRTGFTRSGCSGPCQADSSAPPRISILVAFVNSTSAFSVQKPISRRDRRDETEGSFNPMIIPKDKNQVLEDEDAEKNKLEV